jgi:hypothetical protein
MIRRLYQGMASSHADNGENDFTARLKGVP